MARPVIGICTALERARWSVWDQHAYLLPRSYIDAVRERVERAFGPGALLRRRRCRRGTVGRGLPFTARAKKALELGLREAVDLGERDLRGEHLVLGLLREGDGVAARVLAQRGVTHAAVHAKVAGRDAA